MEENKGKKYTKKEEDYICEYWGIYSSQNIARNLNRSVRGIICKANQLKLGKMSEYAGLFSIMQLCEIFSLSKKTVSRWCDLYGLRYKTLNHKENTILKRRYIEYDNLMSWLEKNQNKFDSTKIEPYALGEEPNWLIEKRKNDLKNPSKKIVKNYRRKIYTTNEINSIWNMKYLLNKTYREIAEWYGISRDSVICVLKAEKKRREKFGKQNSEIKTSA